MSPPSFRLLRPTIALLLLLAASFLFAAPASAGFRRASSTPEAAIDRIAGDIAGDIWVMNADGSARRQLTETPESDFDPSWSPDGTQLVFRASRGHYAPDWAGMGAEGIFVVNVDGSGERQLWPPDAQTTGGLFPDWGPDGRIAFSGYGSDGTGETTYLINADGTGLVDLHAPGEGPVWSPDGAKIIYGRHPGNGDWQVWVMDADGSHQTQLTFAPAVVHGGPGGNKPGVWSPDGTRIAFASDRADGASDVWVMEADGGHQTRLTALPGSQNPNAWLPDGRIVYADWGTGKETPDWYAMNADGTGVAPLPQLTGVNEPIDWLQPTGEALLATPAAAVPVFPAASRAARPVGPLGWLMPAVADTRRVSDSPHMGAG